MLKSALPPTWAPGFHAETQGSQQDLGWAKFSGSRNPSKPKKEHDHASEMEPQNPGPRPPCSITQAHGQQVSEILYFQGEGGWLPT